MTPLAEAPRTISTRPNASVDRLMCYPFSSVLTFADLLAHPPGRPCLGVIEAIYGVATDGSVQTLPATSHHLLDYTRDQGKWYSFLSMNVSPIILLGFVDATRLLCAGA
jgi:hypothetical protein